MPSSVSIRYFSGHQSDEDSGHYIENEERKTQGIEKSNFKINPVKNKSEEVKEELLTSDVKTKVESKEALKETKTNANFTNNDEIVYESDFVNQDDLLVLISARKNAVSYQKYLDHIPSKLEKHFNSNKSNTLTKKN